MRKISLLAFGAFSGALTLIAAPSDSPSVPPTPVASSSESITNPNTTPGLPQAQQGGVLFDVKKLAATARPAVALITVFDKSGKPLKLGTGFFVSSDGKLVTNAHVIADAESATAKLEN